MRLLLPGDGSREDVEPMVGLAQPGAGDYDAPFAAGVISTGVCR